MDESAIRQFSRIIWPKVCAGMVCWVWYDPDADEISGEFTGSREKRFKGKERNYGRQPILAIRYDDNFDTPKKIERFLVQECKGMAASMSAYRKMMYLGGFRRKTQRGIPG